MGIAVEAEAGEYDASMAENVVCPLLFYVPYYSTLLLADNPLAIPSDSASSSVTLQAAAQGLLDYAQTLTEGEELMFTMDVPYVPAQDTPIVLAQAATPGATATPQPDFILTGCGETVSTGDPRSAIRAVDPAYMLKNYIQDRDNHLVALASIKNITLLESTTHGKLLSGTSNYGRTTYHYDAEPNYVGNDKAVFMAEFEGKVYKIVINLVVSLVVDESPLMTGETPVCPPPTHQGQPQASVRLHGLRFRL